MNVLFNFQSLVMLLSWHRNSLPINWKVLNDLVESHVTSNTLPVVVNGW